MKLTEVELQQIKTIGVDCPTVKECDALIKKCFAVLLMNTEMPVESSPNSGGLINDVWDDKKL